MLYFESSTKELSKKYNEEGESNNKQVAIERERKKGVFKNCGSDIKKDFNSPKHAITINLLKI